MRPAFGCQENGDARRQIAGGLAIECYCCEDDFGLGLHVLEDAVDAGRIGQEVGEGRSRHIRGELGAGVAVEELGHFGALETASSTFICKAV